MPKSAPRAYNTKMLRLHGTLALIALLAHHTSLALGALLYPAASVLQITSSFSAPVEIPDRKLFWDWGFQMNYDLPSSLKQFYTVPIWPDKFQSKRDLNSESMSRNASALSLPDKYDLTTSQLLSSDFSAGELYHSFENLLVNYGFHETCLLRSVCELARHPFADEQQNILTEVLTFLLTPSLHEAFAETENLYREVYQEAERRGFLGENCASLYFECKVDFLSAITKIMSQNDVYTQ